MPRIETTLLLTRFHLLSIWNWRSLQYGRLVEPVAYLVFLVAGISGVVSNSAQAQDSYISFVLPGLVVLVAFRGWDATVIDVANDKKWGVYALSRIHGIGSMGYLLSIMLVGMMMFLLQAALVVGIGVGVFDVRGLSVSHLLPAVILVSMTWTAVGCAVGATVNSYNRRDLVTKLTALPVVLSAPLLYSLDNAPGYLKAVAHFNPVTYQIGWVREVVAGRTVDLLPLAALAAAAIVAALVSLRRVDWLSNER